MGRHLHIEPNLDIVILTIILIFGRTYMPWVTRNDIESPLELNNVEICIPLRYYPESNTQAASYLIILRFIYHVLARFVMGHTNYYQMQNHIVKYIPIRFDHASYTVHITILHLTTKHIDAIKSTVCETLLAKLANKLTAPQATFTAYIAAFNTVLHIAHNRSDYDYRIIYSYLAPTTNIPATILPHLAAMLNADRHIRHVSYRQKCGKILLYPMNRNIMSNNKSLAIRSRCLYINLGSYISITNSINALEHIINGYRRHCAELYRDSMDYYTIWDIDSSDVFLF